MSKLLIPEHVAIIMDGNGRWAKAKGVPAIKGHKEGAEVARAITKHAASVGVKYLTLYTFSFENWHRDISWINDLMGLLRWFLKDKVADLMENDVRILTIGDHSLLPQDIQKLIEDVQEKTKNNKRITVTLALSYSGRNEIMRSIKAITQSIIDGKIEPKDINDDLICDFLDTKGMPDPDLLIRTSGEMRISNFLLWQMAYTEYVFTKQLWPDFTVDDFDKALEEYQHRHRRFGREK